MQCEKIKLFLPIGVDTCNAFKRTLLTCTSIPLFTSLCDVMYLVILTVQNSQERLQHNYYLRRKAHVKHWNYWTYPTVACWYCCWYCSSWVISYTFLRLLCGVRLIDLITYLKMKSQCARVKAGNSSFDASTLAIKIVSKTPERGVSVVTPLIIPHINRCITFFTCSLCHHFPWSHFAGKVNK